MSTTAAAARQIPLAKPRFDKREEELVLAVLRSGWVAQGPRVAELEQGFAEAVGAAAAVAVSSGTTALFLALHALRLGPGDEVIVPSLSFIASTNAVVHAGATPVFVDVDPRTYNLAPGEVAAAVTARTRCVMVVHQLGLPADLAALEEIAGRNQIAIVEDAACAIGARYRGRPIGSFGHVACWSLHPRKVLVAGEGGMITTDDAALAERLRRLRHQGMSISAHDRHRADRVLIETYEEVGYNFRMSDLQAALGIGQLEKLHGFLAERRQIARRYDAAWADFPEIQPADVPDGVEPNYQSYIVRVRDGIDRDRLMDALLARGVSTRRGLMAAHLEPCYQARGSWHLPHTEKAAAQTLVLPIYSGFSEDDQDYVLAQIRIALDEQRAAPVLSRASERSMSDV